MKTDTVTKLKRPASAVQLPPDDPLTTLLREGAQKLIAQAVEAELQTLLERHADKRTEDGRLAVVRNGYSWRVYGDSRQSRAAFRESSPTFSGLFAGREG